MIIFVTSLPLFFGGETSVRYQLGFSRKVQLISSLESGQSMFKSHLFPKLKVKVKALFKAGNKSENTFLNIRLL